MRPTVAVLGAGSVRRRGGPKCLSLGRPQDIALSHYCYRRRKTFALQGPRKLPKLDVAGSTPVARSREIEELGATVLRASRCWWLFGGYSIPAAEVATISASRHSWCVRLGAIEREVRARDPSTCTAFLSV